MSEVAGVSGGCVDDGVDVDVSVGVLGEWTEDVGADGMEWFIHFDGAIGKGWCRRDGPKLLADGAGMNETSDVFAHVVPIVPCDLELAKSGVDSTMAEGVIVCRLDDGEVFSRNGTCGGGRFELLEVRHVGSDEFFVV